MPEIINGQPSAAEVQSHIDTDTPATLLNTTHRSSDGKNHADVVTNTAGIATNVTAIGLNTTHRGLASGNPHSVTPAELSLVIGTNTQAFGAALDDLSALGAPASDGQFIVATGAGVFAYESGTTVRDSLGLGTGNSPEFTGTYLSCGVAHGMTEILATDQYSWIGAAQAANGGVQFWGLTDSDLGAFTFFGLIGVENPTDTTPAISLSGSKKGGTSWQDLAATETIFHVLNRTGPVFAMLGNGNAGFGKVLAPAGTVSIGEPDEGSVATLNFKTVHETHTLAAAAQSDTTTISIPSGALLTSVQFCVNTAVVDSAGDDTWTAAFITGNTSNCTPDGAAAAAQNTKVDTMLDANAGSLRTTDVTQIRFTPNGGNFSAGVIEIVVQYKDLTSMANV